MILPPHWTMREVCRGKILGELSEAYYSDYRPTDFPVNRNSDRILEKDGMTALWRKAITTSSWNKRIYYQFLRNSQCFKEQNGGKSMKLCVCKGTLATGSCHIIRGSRKAYSGDYGTGAGHHRIENVRCRWRNP